MRPDTPIQLPKRQLAALAKKSRQKDIPPEVELLRLKARLRRLRLSVCLLLLALALTVGAFVYHIIQEKATPTLAGSSYTVHQQK